MSFGKKFDAYLKAKNKPIETTINRDLIVNQVASLLYALKVVPDNLEITNIQFSDLFGASEAELCDLKIYTRKEVKKKIGKKEEKGT